MTEAGPAQLVAASIMLVAVVLLGIYQLPKWWSGSSRISPETPPDGWMWGARSWAHLARGLPVSLLMLGLGSLAVLASLVAQPVSWGLIVATVAIAVVWLALVLFARPRGLVPPSWRPRRE